MVISKWKDIFYSDLPAILVPVTVRHERYYGMLSYHLKEWLHPGAYYSVTYPNTDSRSEPKDFSKDLAAFVRVDLTPNWIFKAEWHYVDGTVGLSPQMNDDKALNDMDRYWQMFAVKTTIFF